MTRKKQHHDTIYKNLFSDPLMVRSLVQDFVPADIVAELDLDTLERCPDTYVTDTLRERFDDMVWRVRWKKEQWYYLVILLEFQSRSDAWMALRIHNYTSEFWLDLVKTERIKRNPLLWSLTVQL